MKLDARITTLEFSPGDSLRVKGWAHSQFNESKIAGNLEEFNIAWFWSNDIPKEVVAAMTDIVNIITGELQWQGVIPKVWPGKLAGEADDGVFRYKMDKIVLQNPDWNVGRRTSYVDVLAHSKAHNEGKSLTSQVTLRLLDDDLKRLFKVLDECL